ncbi:uncharacterized protein [Drosophila kikkawai]|uniref:Uncharacterized protein n=1 Tax=Drosophila kikkawai TaxID=30033 RepID=A0ABM3C507_DROKI|nr:uncharacterized protein LOC108085760 [Drosophila kikkawai]KAH8343201.1 hypothetical protein KR059_006334 [Drosophila kikkawai]
MSDNRKFMMCAYNGLLCAATGFGLIKIGPSEHPYAFAACVIGFARGVINLVTTLVNEDDETLRELSWIVGHVMDVVPLPLINVSLYLKAESNNIALAHGLFLLPLGVTWLLRKLRNEGDFEEFGTVPTLKILTILGNITSLVFLAINDSSWILGGMAALAFMTEIGANYCNDHLIYDSAMPICYFSWSAFYILAALVVTGEK